MENIVFKKLSRQKFTKTIIDQVAYEFPEILMLIAGGELAFFYWNYRSGNAVCETCNHPKKDERMLDEAKQTGKKIE